MSPAQLARKLAEIKEVLSAYNVEFGFVNALPPEVLYKYLVEECIPNDMVSATIKAGFTWTLDGCDGGCEGCFQREYCPTAEEILKDENGDCGE
jgi:hypothetical protein